MLTIDQTANNNALPLGYTNYTNYPKTYSWNIANDDNYLASGTAKIKVSAKTPLDAAVTSTSAAFSVREPYLTLSLPQIVQNSGKWVQGDSIAFNWSADGYLSPNGQLRWPTRPYPARVIIWIPRPGSFLLGEYYRSFG